MHKFAHEVHIHLFMLFWFPVAYLHFALKLSSSATVLLFYVAAAFGIFLGRTYFLEVFSVHFRLARLLHHFAFFMLLCLVFVSHLIMEILAAKRIFA